MIYDVYWKYKHILSKSKLTKKKIDIFEGKLSKKKFQFPLPLCDLWSMLVDVFDYDCRAYCETCQRIKKSSLFCATFWGLEWFIEALLPDLFDNEG